MIQRIMITGGSGFVGCHIMPMLAKAFPQAVVSNQRFDITDTKLVIQQVKGFQPDAVLHLAGISAVRKAAEYPRQAWNVNLIGTLNLAHAILEQARQCRLVHVSTADVYGRTFQKISAPPLDEEAKLDPLNTYSATKAAADLALGAMVADGLNVIRMRPLNHTGPGQSDEFVVATFARQVAAIEAGLQPPIIKVGSLDTFRDFLDVRDVCSAYIAVLAHENIPSGTIFNLASGHPIQISSILDTFLSAARCTIDVRQDPSRLRNADIFTPRCNTVAAQQQLQWKPRIPFAQTLTEVLEYWRHKFAAAA